MKIRKLSKAVYCVEMTEAQAQYLLMFLTTTDSGHVNELAVQAHYGAKIADGVHETLIELCQALQNKKEL